MNLKNIIWTKHISYKRVNMAWFHLYEVQEPQTYNKIKAAGAKRLGRNKRGNFLMVMKLFCILLGVYITQAYAFVTTYHIVYLRYVEFTVHKFCLKTSIWKKNKRCLHLFNKCLTLLFIAIRQKKPLNWSQNDLFYLD